MKFTKSKFKGFRALARKKVAQRKFLCGHKKTKANTIEQWRGEGVRKVCRKCVSDKFAEVTRERRKVLDKSAPDWRVKPMRPYPDGAPVLDYLKQRPLVTFADVQKAIGIDEAALVCVFSSLSKRGEIIRTTGTPRKWLAA